MAHRHFSEQFGEKKWQHRTGLPVKKLNLHIHDVLVSRHKFVTHLETHLQRNG